MKSASPRRFPRRWLMHCAVSWLIAPGLANAATPLHFQAYLDAVEQHNLELAGQREAMNAAQAGIGIAGLRPDPELTWEMSREQNRAHHPRPISRGPALAWTLETGGKRRARLRLARSEVAVASAHQQAVLHQVYADAATAFADACHSRAVMERKELTLQSLEGTVRANETRHRLGDIGGVELLQSRVERDRFQAEVIQARAEADAARLALSIPLGGDVEALLGGAGYQCGFVPFTQGEDLAVLLPAAMQARDEIRAARAEMQRADDGAALVRANRWLDPTLSVGVSSTRGFPAGIDAEGGVIDAIPRSRELTVSIAVPIPLSRRNRGDLVQADAERTQAALALRQAERVADTEVRAAHRRFLAARESVGRYRDGVLADAQRALAGIRLSYRNGASSLLELLDAQRSADEAELDCLQAEYDLAMATVALQLAIGQRPHL